MNYEKLLPIGTVVMLKKGSKRVMITGFCTATELDKNKIYDYIGVLYPEGFITSNKNLLFDHDQIDKIFYYGLIDDEEKNFKSKLNQIMKQVNK